MIRYATRLPPNKPVELLDNGLVRKTAKASSDSWMNFMEELLTYQINSPKSYIVPVYDYQIVSGEKDGAIYQYDMMRCGILTVSERELINTVGNLHDRHGVAACQQDLFDLHFYAKQHPKLFDFLKMIVEQNQYWDIHSGNILMNEDREYCLIDLEGFKEASIEKVSDDWTIK